MSVLHVRKVAEVWVRAPFTAEDAPRTERRFRATCSCGWYGTGSAIRARACREWHRHVEGPVIGAIRTVTP